MGGVCVCVWGGGGGGGGGGGCMGVHRRMCVCMDVRGCAKADVITAQLMVYNSSKHCCPYINH